MFIEHLFFFYCTGIKITKLSPDTLVVCEEKAELTPTFTHCLHFQEDFGEYRIIFEEYNTLSFLFFSIKKLLNFEYEYVSDVFFLVLFSGALLHLTFTRPAFKYTEAGALESSGSSKCLVTRALLAAHWCSQSLSIRMRIRKPLLVPPRQAADSIG